MKRENRLQETSRPMLRLYEFIVGAWMETSQREEVWVHGELEARHSEQLSRDRCELEPLRPLLRAATPCSRSNYQLLDEDTKCHKGKEIPH